MQATSTSALEPVASDQSLTWPPEIHGTKRTPHSAASDQTEYTWINHKRPVACKVARFEDKKKWYKEKEQGS